MHHSQSAGTLLDRYHDILREHFIEYTRRAFQVLPKLRKPRILDIGCGSGVPTLELARLSGGDIVGIDVDLEALERLSRKAEEAGLSNRVRAVRCSLFDLDFAEGSFDIIWAEGSIASIGFEKGLKEWRRFIKLDGFLAVHDDEGNVEEKLALISDCGYRLIDHFIVPGDIWWTDYYRPLKKRIEEIRNRDEDDRKVIARMEEDQHWIDEFKKNPQAHGSVFFVMQKT